MTIRPAKHPDYKFSVRFIRESEDNPVITAVNIRCLYDTQTSEGIKTKYLNVTYRYIENSPNTIFSSGIYRKDNTLHDGCTQLPTLINSQVYLHGSDDYRRKTLKRIIMSDSFFHEKVFNPCNISNLHDTDMSTWLSAAPPKLRALLMSRTFE